MKHYDSIEWILYKEKVWSSEKILAMEEHLYTCDECMDIFTSLISEEEILQAESHITPDFTPNVLESIENIRPISNINREDPSKDYKKTKDFFIYYVAVASVTIILTLGGFYSRLIDIVPSTRQLTRIENKERFPDMVAGISGKIVNRTSVFINDVEKTKIREGLR